MKEIFRTFKNYKFIGICIYKYIRTDKYLFDKFDNLSQFLKYYKNTDNQILTKVFTKTF